MKILNKIENILIFPALFISSSWFAHRKLNNPKKTDYVARILLSFLGLFIWLSMAVILYLLIILYPLLSILIALGLVIIGLISRSIYLSYINKDINMRDSRIKKAKETIGIIAAIFIFLIMLLINQFLFHAK